MSQYCCCAFSRDLSDREQIQLCSWIVGQEHLCSLEDLCFCLLPAETQSGAIYAFLLHECVTPEMYIEVESDTCRPDEAPDIVQAALLLYMLFKFGRPLDYYRNAAGLEYLYRMNARLSGEQLAAKLDVNDIKPILEHFNTIRRTNDFLRDKEFQAIHQDPYLAPDDRVLGTAHVEEKRSEQLLSLYYGATFQAIFGYSLCDYGSYPPTDVEERFSSVILQKWEFVCSVARHQAKYPEASFFFLQHAYAASG
ncbi:hypothetical protein BJ166DRAFT_620982 [Pestalotiopsis sp. NC0098]|nr:hypothetical protein BJ166DRAFT_620982 [Pestalotiopsis sp. NC0098]